MASILGHLHFWSMKKLAAGTGLDVGTNCYHEKTGTTADDGHAQYKRLWGEQRGIPWIPKNKRPEKLRDNLRECEEMLQNYKATFTRWRTLRNFQLLLNNGAILSFLVANNSGDVDAIFIDKSLVGKIPDQVSHAVMTEGFLVFSFLDKAKLFYIYLGKKSSLDFKKAERISSLEPKMSYTEFPGPSKKRIERHLSINQRQDMVAVWWATQGDEAWPWSPNSEKDRSNMIIFGLNGNKLEMLCYVRTECDPLDLSFSYNQPHHVHTVEQSLPGGDNIPSIDSCIYEYTKNKIERVTVKTIPVNSPVKIHQRNHAEDKLLVGCQDGTLMLYDSHRRITQMTKAAVMPSFIRWHPADTIVFVCSNRGEIQIFDMALAPLTIQLIAENPQPMRILALYQYFRNPVKLDLVSWSCEAPIMNITEGSVGCHDSLLILFDGGPVCLLRVELGVMSHGRLGAVELVSEYIKHNQGDEAVNFLNSMNWNTDGNACFACMTLIMNHLLRLTLNSEREGLLEETLGSFYAPSRPLSDVTVLQFRDPISRLSRRFFHHLLRYKRFEKAFLLAVDIGAKDLFMDIHYLASDVGNYALADVAKQRAIQIDNDSLSASDTAESYDDNDSYEGSPQDGDGLVSNDQRPYNADRLAQTRSQSLGKVHDDSSVLGLANPKREDTTPQVSSTNTCTNEQELQASGAASGPAGGTLKIVHFGVV